MSGNSTFRLGILSSLFSKVDLNLLYSFSPRRRIDREHAWGQAEGSQSPGYRTAGKGTGSRGAARWDATWSYYWRESAPLLLGLFKDKSEYSGGGMLKTAMFFVSLLILVIDSDNGLKTGPMIQKQNSMREEGFLKHALWNGLPEERGDLTPLSDFASKPPHPFPQHPKVH